MISLLHCIPILTLIREGHTREQESKLLINSKQLRILSLRAEKINRPFQEIYRQENFFWLKRQVPKMALRRCVCDWCRKTVTKYENIHIFQSINLIGKTLQTQNPNFSASKPIQNVQLNIASRNSLTGFLIPTGFQASIAVPCYTYKLTNNNVCSAPNYIRYSCSVCLVSVFEHLKQEISGTKIIFKIIIIINNNISKQFALYFLSLLHS